MTLSLKDKKLSHGVVPDVTVVPVVVVGPAGGATAGIAGAKFAVPAKGDTLVIGTAGAALTPRFPIS
jgi:hypothetical protein